MKRIGEIIRDMRKARGWTAIELARRAGLRDCMISMEENRLLAELRDAMLPELMSGKLDVEKEAQK